MRSARHSVRRAEVALDELAERAVRVAAVSAEVLEVELVVLDPADRERQLDLEHAQPRVDLVRRFEVDLAELAEDLVPLVHVALVQLVVGLDGLAGDAVQLEKRGLQLAGDDRFERWPRHRSPSVGGGMRAAEHNG